MVAGVAVGADGVEVVGNVDQVVEHLEGLVVEGRVLDAHPVHDPLLVEHILALGHVVRLDQVRAVHHSDGEVEEPVEGGQLRKSRLVGGVLGHEAAQLVAGHGGHEGRVEHGLEVEQHAHDAAGLVPLVGSGSVAGILVIGRDLGIHTIEIDNVSQQVLEETRNHRGGVREALHSVLAENVEVFTRVVANPGRITGVLDEFGGVEDVVFEVAV